jgi:hypothetical protein
MEKDRIENSQHYDNSLTRTPLPRRNQAMSRSFYSIQDSAHHFIKKKRKNGKQQGTCM